MSERPPVDPFPFEDRRDALLLEIMELREHPFLKGKSDTLEKIEAFRKDIEVTDKEETLAGAERIIDAIRRELGIKIP